MYHVYNENYFLIRRIQEGKIEGKQYGLPHFKARPWTFGALICTLLRLENRRASRSRLKEVLSLYR